MKKLHCSKAVEFRERWVDSGNLGFAVSLPGQNGLNPDATGKKVLKNLARFLKTPARALPKNRGKLLKCAWLLQGVYAVGLARRGPHPAPRLDGSGQSKGRSSDSLGHVGLVGIRA
jgi:hypothetical protein